MNKSAYMLWQGQVISQLGSQAFSLVMMFWLMEQTNSAAFVGTVVLATMLIGILLMPVGGLLADRFNRKSILITVDLVRGVCVLMLAAFLFTHTASTAAITAFVVMAMINAAMKAIFQPTIDASIPELVSAKALSKTLAWFSGSAQLTQICGQLAGGIFYRILGAPILLLFDGLSYVISAMFIMAIPATQFTCRQGPDHKTVSSVWRDLGRGWHYLRQHNGLWFTLWLLSGVNFFYGPFLLLLPFFVSTHLGLDANWYGFFLAAMAAGSIVGLSVAPKLAQRFAQKPLLIGGALAFSAFGFMAMGLSTMALPGLCFIFMAGLGLSIFNLLILTQLQLSIPSELRGRVLSFVGMLAGAMLPLGLWLGGISAEMSGLPVSVFYVFDGLCVLVLATLLVLSKQSRQFLIQSGKDTRLA